MTPAVLVGTVFLKPLLVIVAAAVIAACLSRYTAAARHAVWTGAIIATLALPLLGVALPALRVPALLTTVERILPDGGFAAAIGNGKTRTTPIAKGTPSGNGALATVDVRAVRPADRLPGLMVVIWLLGALLLATRRLVAEFRVRRIVGRGRPVSQRLERLYCDVARAAGIHQPVSLLLSVETMSPAVTGVVHPVILLPEAADAWPDADLVTIFAHELGHVERHDCLLNFCADLATAMYWCNPMVRLVASRMHSESERACDDRVLRAGAEPERYAHLLLGLANGARVSGSLPSAATAMARPSQLESRLLALLDARVRRAPLPRWMPITLAGASVIVALPAAALTLGPAAVTAAQLTAVEPDRLADSLASPTSERVPLPPDAYRVSPAAAQALAGPDSSLAGRMVAALGRAPDGDADLVRERAAWTLGQARGGKLIEPLLDALEARDWRVQAYAAWALATARDARAVPRLIPLIGHPSWRLRAMAAYALRELGDPLALDAMNAALTDAAWQVRVEAVEYFAALGGSTLSERFRSRLADRHIAVRLAAERALTAR